MIGINRVLALQEIACEANRGADLHGPPPGGLGPPVVLADLHTRLVAQERCEAARRAGTLSWREVLTEEVAEVFAEQPGSARQRVELTHVAAVVLAMIEAIDAAASEGLAAEQREREAPARTA